MSLLRDLTRGPSGYLLRNLDRSVGAAASVSTDSDFPNNVMLLDFAGADGATDITDLSNRPYDDTFVGDAEVDTALTFLGKNSLLLDGAGDEVQFPAETDWDFGTSDFTVEFGVRSTNVGIVHCPLANFSTSGLIGFYCQINGTGDEFIFGWGATVMLTETWAPTVNTWYHVAVCRSGTDLRLFIDGTQVGSTTTDSTDMAGASTQKLFVGSLRAGVQTFTGSIGAVRVTKGFARYTSNFTTLTSFYLLGADPPNPTFSKIVLLHDFAGSDEDTDITDLSSAAHTETFVSNAQVDTAKTFIGKNTLLFGGGSDRVTYPDHNDWDFGTGDFCVEFGVSLVNLTNNFGMVSSYDPTTDGWWVQRASTSNGELHFGIGDSVLIAVTWDELKTNRFYHVAVTRSGSTLQAYVDGLPLGASVSNSSDFANANAGLFLGALNASLQSLSGSLGAVRITKGEAVYTSKFNPPKVMYPTS